MAITVNLDQVLAKQKISLQQLSKRSGISVSDLKTLKTVEFIDPRFRMLEQICKVLDCDISDVLSGKK